LVLRFRRYGAAPRTGLSLHFERTLAYVTGLANVRDAIPLPENAGECKVLTHHVGAFRTEEDARTRTWKPSMLPRLVQAELIMARRA
jgi:aspartyl-tRNA synthetase